MYKKGDVKLYYSYTKKIYMSNQACYLLDIIAKTKKSSDVNEILISISIYS